MSPGCTVQNQGAFYSNTLVLLFKVSPREIGRLKFESVKRMLYTLEKGRKEFAGMDSSLGTTKTETINIVWKGR